ncbi:SsgA family sporulation/cell division regulator [Streptomyces fagopyri]|uniref:SsgA family sporulation/cell division regulator n=1 Tax=Streptomyces fagopyri TaxID=2662397 RepID=UPI003405272B
MSRGVPEARVEVFSRSERGLMPHQQSGLPAAQRPVRRMRSLGLRLDRILDPSLRIPLEATFHYTEADPLVVRVELTVSEGRTVAWALSRDLLFDGTEEPSGIGDVRLWPSAVGTHRVLHMRLEVGSASCLFEMDLGQLQDWLLDTFALVHPGTELDEVDWDAVTADLFGGGEDRPRR